VLRTPDVGATVAFFRDLLDGDVEATRDRRVELAWPRGARVAIEQHDGASPGVDRLEVEGLDEPVDVIGTAFVPA
jgi:hypothetical protein